MKPVILGLLPAILFAGAADARSIDTLPLGNGLTFDYYVSAPPGADDPNILIAMHGYTRDADRTYDAAANAADAAGHTGDTLIVAPIFQVPAGEAGKCQFKNVPDATPTDALWHCNDWSDGDKAINGSVTAFQAMDDLIAALAQRYPSARNITVSGFSAGGQFVQHYIGFAQTPPPSISLRYVVADPSEFVYFDPVRPGPDTASCPNYNDWKFGTDHLPAYFTRSAADARTVYANAKVQYLEGGLDSGMQRGAAYKLLEKNCSAELQGPFRLQRGQAYAAYDAKMLSHGAHPLTVVPGCGHAVKCVFPSPAARTALFGPN